MGAKGISISHIKSHLQMYRSSKNNNFSRQMSPRNSTLGTADKSTQEVVSTSRLECRRARASDHQDAVPHAHTRAPDEANNTVLSCSNATYHQTSIDLGHACTSSSGKVFGSWEQGQSTTFRAPWSSFNVLTAEKWKLQAVDGCELTLSIGGGGAGASGEESMRDVEGSSISVQLPALAVSSINGGRLGYSTGPPAAADGRFDPTSTDSKEKKRSGHRPAINLDLTISSPCWLVS